MTYAFRVKFYTDSPKIDDIDFVPGNVQDINEAIRWCSNYAKYNNQTRSKMLAAEEKKGAPHKIAAFTLYTVIEHQEVK